MPALSVAVLLATAVSVSESGLLQDAKNMANIKKSMGKYFKIITWVWEKVTGKVTFSTVDLFYKVSRFNRKELLTTLMLEKAIAPAAKIGLNSRKKSGAQANGANIPAAIGMRTLL